MDSDDIQILWSVFYLSTYLILATVCPHFIGEETEAPRGRATCLMSPANKGDSVWAAETVF